MRSCLYAILPGLLSPAATTAGNIYFLPVEQDGFQIIVVQQPQQQQCASSCMPSCQPSCVQSVSYKSLSWLILYFQACPTACQPMCSNSCVQQQQQQIVVVQQPQQQCVSSCMPSCQSSCVSQVRVFVQFKPDGFCRLALPPASPCALSPASSSNKPRLSLFLLLPRHPAPHPANPAAPPAVCNSNPFALLLVNHLARAVAATMPSVYRFASSPKMENRRRLQACLPSCESSCVSQSQPVVVIQQVSFYQRKLLPNFAQSESSCPQACQPQCSTQCVQQQAICTSACQPSCQSSCGGNTQCVQACLPSCQQSCSQQQPQVISISRFFFILQI